MSNTIKRFGGNGNVQPEILAAMSQPPPSRSHVVIGLECQVKTGTPDRAKRGPRGNRSKYAMVLEMMRSLTKKSGHIEIQSQNTKGSRLTQAIRQAVKNNLSDEEYSRYEIFTTDEGNTAISVRNNE